MNVCCHLSLGGGLIPRNYHGLSNSCKSRYSDALGDMAYAWLRAASLVDSSHA
jgi:hypothetical protein